MSEPFLSELKCVAFTFAPRGWTMSNGQLLPINQNQALFSLLGTTYGGDGRVNFGLPNLQGRAPMSMGNGHTLGEQGGEYNHTLTINELPRHIHILQGIAATENAFAPGSNMFANTQGNLTVYGPLSSQTLMYPTSISNAGSSQPHPNQSPYLVMTWIIALQGIFPSQT